MNILRSVLSFARINVLIGLRGAADALPFLLVINLRIIGFDEFIRIGNCWLMNIYLKD
jgi:hypothetical protein